MQIAVNIQVGEASFVYEGIAPPDMYDRLTKKQLRDMPGMHREVYSPTWAQRVCDHINGKTPKKRPKADLYKEAAKARPFPLTIALIKESCIEHERVTGAPATERTWNPVTKKHEPAVFAAGPLEGQSIHAVSHAIRQRGRGLREEGIPDHVTSIRDFQIWQGLNIYEPGQHRRHAGRVHALK